jgi:hypothetical protein
MRLVGFLRPPDVGDIGLVKVSFADYLERLSEEDDCDYLDDNMDDLWVRPTGVIDEVLIQHLRQGPAKQRWIEAWMSLVKLIGQLPALRDLVYTSAEQIPSCLPSILHQHHPSCRLHVTIFDLRSLHQPNGSPHDIDPDEFKLVTSPCLYSITFYNSPLIGMDL